MLFILIIFGMDFLCEDEALYINSQYVFWRGVRGLHPNLLQTNDVNVLELKDQMSNKLLEQLLRMGGDGGRGGGDDNGGCYGYIRVNNNDNKNVLSGETRAMPYGNYIIVVRTEGMLSRNLEK